MPNALPKNLLLTQAFFADAIEQILALQRINLSDQISDADLPKEGSGTLAHDIFLLEALNEPYPYIIAKVDK